MNQDTIPQRLTITYATSVIERGKNMNQLVRIKWNPIEFGSMPEEEGTYLIAWNDGTVESYPMDHKDITDGEIKSGSVFGVYWAEGIPHPDM